MSGPLRALILEGNPADAELVVAELRYAGFDLEWERVDTRADFLAALSSRPDVVLADCRLLQFGAMPALELMTERRMAIPCIVVTGAQDEEQAIECLKHGAVDYLLKDRLSRLGQAVVNAIEIKRANGHRESTGAAVDESEALHRAIIENVNDSIIIVLEGKLVFANDAFLNLCGLKDRSEAIGQPEERFIHLEDRASVRNESMTIRPSGANIYEYRVLRADNETRAVQVSTSSTDFQGQRALFRVLRDMTETRRIEVALSAWEIEVAERAHEDSVLTEIGRIISSSLDIDQVYERFAEQVNTLIPFDRTTILRVDHERQVMTDVYQHGTKVPNLASGTVVPFAGSQTEQAVRTRSSQLVQIEDRNELNDLYPAMLTLYDAGLRSFLVAPLVSQGGVIGVLQLQSTRSLAYDQRDLALAERVADQIAGAIANAQLHASRERQSKERQVLAEIGRIISSSLDINEVYEPFADQVRQIIPFDRIVICDIDLERSIFAARYVQGINIPGMESDEPRSLQRSLVAEVARSPAGMVKYFGEADGAQYEFPKLVSWYRAGIRSAIGVPLVSGDDVPCVLFLASTATEAYDENTLELANRVGDQISGAIANSLLFAERVRAEEALVESESRFRGVFEHSPIAIGLVAPGGRIIDVNEAMCKLLGYTVDELVGRHSMNFLHPDDGKENEALMQRVLSGGSASYTTEQRYVTKNGSIIWGRATGAVIKDEAGNNLFRMGIIEDVTERRQAERAIREGDERFRSVVDSTSDAVISIDSAGIVVAWNPSAERVFGFDESEMLGQTLAIVMPERFVAQYERALGQLKAGGGLSLFEKTVELVGRRKNSSEFPMELSLAV